MPAYSELNDLLALGQTMDEWGDNLKDRLPALPKLAIIFNALVSRAFDRKDAQYDALDESAYQALKKNGLSCSNQTSERAVLEKALHMRDKHIRIISRTTRIKTLATAFTRKPDNLTTLIMTAERYQLHSIEKVLKKSFG